MAGDGFGVPISEIDTFLFGADLWTAEGLNPFRSWTAWLDEPERWKSVTDDEGESFLRLEEGGIHYGHLEVNLARSENCDDAYRLTMTPVYSFPITDASYQLVGDTERRVYDDVVTVRVGADGAPVAANALGECFDADRDGLLDDTEFELGTDPLVADSDGDGVSDFDEVNRDGDASSFTPGVDTDPLNRDTDGDTIADGVDARPLRADTVAVPALPYAFAVLLAAFLVAQQVRCRRHAA